MIELLNLNYIPNTLDANCNSMGFSLPPLFPNNDLLYLLISFKHYSWPDIYLTPLYWLPPSCCPVASHFSLALAAHASPMPSWRLSRANTWDHLPSFLTSEAPPSPLLANQLFIDQSGGDGDQCFTQYRVRKWFTIMTIPRPDCNQISGHRNQYLNTQCTKPPPRRDHFPIPRNCV